MSEYIGIRSEGGLLPYDILDQIAKGELPGQQAKDFSLDSGRRVTDEIARAWSDAQDYWHIFQRRAAGLPEDETGTTVTREKWIIPLLTDLLGYELTYQPAGVIVAGKNYPISHRAGTGEESPPVHLDGFRIELDRRPEGRRLSPQALLQEYLNNSEDHLWGPVTNGLRLRLLRDTSRTARPTYLEFDLEGILEGNRFNEFAVFYRVCHRTRLPRTAEDSTSCWLEKWFQTSIEQGGRVRDKLRDGVEEALKLLGTGLLRHPKNAELRERARSGRLTPQEFHRQLLRLVYRLLFLMVAEERRMIVPEGPEAERRQRLYDRYYSVARLRTVAEKPIERSTFGDLWIGLQQTFALFEDTSDSNALGIPPLNGDLFGYTAIKDLRETHLHNDVLLAAICHLSLFEERRVRQRINYAALDVEELGSVYESLLDYQPVFTEQQEGLTFELHAGSERKSTGSYYTRPELVRELIESALVPVMEDRLKQAKDKDTEQQRKAQEQALLSMAVCDPACGSGHFLLAAARRLGRELARVRTGEEEPTPKEFHLAVREVITHCIYGVDLNPLAVDLCKLALWLEGHWTGKPLSFLDHRIKCGNSLIGVLEPTVLEEGVPDTAFNPVTGDDKDVAKAFKKRNREERKGQPSLPFDVAQHVHDYATEYQKLTGIAEDTPAGVREKAKAYEAWRGRKDWWHDWTACNIWTAAFFVPLAKFDDPTVPTDERLLRFTQRQDSQAQMAAAAHDLAGKLRFFHWRLEFPEVFEKGGFDVVLGNPPWDIIQPEEVSFFRSIGYTGIADLTGHERKVAIQRLCADRPDVGEMWKEHQRTIETIVKFVRHATRFPLTAIGKLDTSSLFAELGFQLLNDSGRFGLVLPSGIATDDNCQRYFSEITTTASVYSLFDFENRERLFPDVAPVQKFCLLTVARRAGIPSRFAWFLTKPQQTKDPQRAFDLTADELTLLNPNTRTSPVFRTKLDALVTTGVYRRIPVLIDSRSGKNPWGAATKQGLFNMTSSSALFKKEQELGYVPLYEAKFIHQFDHRHSTYEGVSAATRFGMKAGTNTPTPLQKKRPDYRIEPRYWVPEAEVARRLPEEHQRNWLIVIRGIVQPMSNERVAMCSILPLVGIAHSCLILFLDENHSARQAACLVANINSIPFDYVLRQKMGGANIIASVLEQMPFVPPVAYSAEDTEFVANRVLQLSFTASDLTQFAADLGYSGPPFIWDDERRLSFRCELDAFYAHIYGLTREELEYIFDPQELFGADFPSETFRILKSRDIHEYGEYRTRRLVLEAFDKLAESPRFRDEMPKRKSAFTPPTRPARVVA